MTGCVAAMGGGQATGVDVQGLSIIKGGNGTSTVTATYTLGSDGTVRDQAGTVRQTWLQFGASSAYEAMVTSLSGSAPTGTLNSWLNLGTDRSWSLAALAGNDNSGTFRVDVRDAASQTLLDSAVITFLVANSP